MIDILMATYNGELYIKNQLLSLQQQTYTDWRLWVRDDGSTDETLSIIETFIAHDVRINLVSDELGSLGAGKCFLQLTHYATADYVIYCDQDDIWFEKKLEILHEIAQIKLNLDKPGLVYCDGYAYSDKEGIITGSSISRVHAKNLRELLFINAGYQGCSMLFNRNLCNMIKGYKADYFYMHDDITTLLAHAFGDVHFINKSLMLYRQHESNVTGNIQYGFAKLFKRVFSDSPVISRVHYDEKKSFFDAYGSLLSQKEQLIFESYILFPGCSLLSRLSIIVRYRFSEGGCFLKLLIKVILKKPIN